MRSVIPGTSLARKLGVAEGSSVLLDGAPAEFALTELPAGTEVRRRLGAGPYDVIVCFCPDRARLVQRWPVLHPRTTPAGGLWIAWPKKASRVPTDMTEDVARDLALANGLVDNKVCAIDATWSGLRLVYRLRDRP